MSSETLYILTACAVLLIMQIVVLVFLRKNTHSLDRTLTDFDADNKNMSTKLDEKFAASNELNRQSTATWLSRIDTLENSLRNDQTSQRKELVNAMDKLSLGLSDIRLETVKSINDIKDSNSRALTNMMSENRQSLQQINDTVNEKLQKTLEERISKSFEAVNQHLSEVYKGIGEMKDVANGVSDLKKILSNVKTRGIVGEYQLDAILTEILTSDQYVSQFKIKPGSRDLVDFAVKLPGSGNDMSGSVYLPIDSKFPADTYASYVDALDTCDSERIREAKKLLASTITAEAKSISEKYIEPPYTTDFAIMFLPFEGLYSEVVNMGLVDKLQTQYHINIAGPSTMAALLNSFRMGFKTLAIQKRSDEVWKTLEAVKKEFTTFENGLNTMKERLTQADRELDKLIGTRTTAINRKLREVSTEESLEAAENYLGIHSTGQ